jgi:hypothetical protein
MRRPGSQDKITVRAPVEVKGKKKSGSWIQGLMLTILLLIRTGNNVKSLYPLNSSISGGRGPGGGLWKDTGKRQDFLIITDIC